MLQLAERWRHLPDAKTLALLAWIRRHQCPGGPQAPWSDRRVIVFTEYGDTERYLHRMLAAAFDGTQDAERRILKFHGGLSDEARDEDGARVHLHLQHPFVQRLLSRFLAQGYCAHDLSRITALRDPFGGQPVVLAFGRLSLFGAGAARLHDQIVTVAAPWLDSGGAEHLRPYEGREEQRVRDRLDRLLRELPADGDPTAGVSEHVRERLRATAPADFAALWPHVDAEADALAHEAERSSTSARHPRIRSPARALLRTQKSALQKALGRIPQLTLAFSPTEPRAREQIRQIEQDHRHAMEDRLLAIDREIETEPAAIQELYRVTLARREPVGMVYLWPGVGGRATTGKQAKKRSLPWRILPSGFFRTSKLEGVLPRLS